MGKFAALDFVVEIATIAATPVVVDLSDHITSVELPVEVEDVETTAFGDEWKRRIPGLKDASVKISWQQDYADSVDDVLWPLFGTTVTVSVRPRSTAVSPTNPEYVLDALVTSYTPIKGEVGGLATFETSWPADGAVERVTA